MSWQVKINLEFCVQKNEIEVLFPTPPINSTLHMMYKINTRRLWEVEPAMELHQPNTIGKKKKQYKLWSHLFHAIYASKDRVGSLNFYPRQAIKRRPMPSLRYCQKRPSRGYGLLTKQKRASTSAQSPCHTHRIGRLKTHSSALGSSSTPWTFSNLYTVWAFWEKPTGNMGHDAWTASMLWNWELMYCSVLSHSVVSAEVGCHALLQGIFPTQGSSPELPHCRQILYRLRYQGSPRILE